MLSLSSRKTHSLRRVYVHATWDKTEYPRGFVDLGQLISLVKKRLSHRGNESDRESDEPLSTRAGQKRAAPHSNETGSPSKRTKTDAVESIDEKTPDEPNSRSIPVYCHTFNIQYIRHDFDVDLHPLNPKTERQFQTDDEELTKLLNRATNAEPSVVDLGPIRIQPTAGGFQTWCDSQDGTQQRVDDANPLLDVPALEGGIDLDAYDFHRQVGSLHAAFLTMYSLRRVAVTACLKISVEKEIPLIVQVEVTLSLVEPEIFSPSPDKEAQRLLLSNIFPYVVPARYQGVTDIPFFYSAIGPAPRLLSDTAEEGAQPDALLPTLLPFQRRSVAWMLRREGKTINDSGDIVPETSTQADCPLFWEKIHFNEGDCHWYFNRLNGTLSPRRPDVEDDWPGGILAEEPGLGKTLESIALVLLNPGVGRTPSNKRYDPEARVDVKEIKTTLIVTPASLAPQWADELALHAPTLKVLIYDGWAKVPGNKVMYDGWSNTPVSPPKKRRQKEEQKINQELKAEPTTTASGSKSKGKTRMTSDDEMEVDVDEQASEIKEDEVDPNDWCSYVNSFDVCIVTYNVLQHDLGVARPPAIRPRREAARGKYSNSERPRSPLVMCEWYRVIMDEVQMVGGGKTEEMVSLIPRFSSFAVSGTPARAQAQDLIHVLKFLRVEPAIASQTWKRLLKPAFASQFSDLFRRLSIRALKSTVHEELTIPHQSRYVVPITLGRVEQHVYDQTLEQALLELGLDARGVAASDSWELDVSLLRTWIRRLRQICTHPQVGQGLLQKAGGKLGAKLLRPGALKTIGEVLEGMRDQNWRNLVDERKAKILSFIREAQLTQRKDSDKTRYQQALDILLVAQKESDKLIQDVKMAIAEHDAKGDLLKQYAASAKVAGMKATNDAASNLDHTDKGQDGPAERIDENVDELRLSASEKGKGKAPERIQNTPWSEDIDSQDDDLPHNPAGDEHRVKRRALQQRLRECYITHHRVVFLFGDVYHMLGPSRLDDERASYTAADDVRRKLLKNTEENAIRAMDQLRTEASRKTVTEKELRIEQLGKGGIKSSELMAEGNELIDLLNEQSALLFQWRTRIFKLLTEKLSAGGNNDDDDDDVDGNEYARTLETQGEAESYLQVYAALMADRREVLVAERTALAAHDAREKKLRHTKAAMKAATALDNPEILEELDLQPEHEVLQKDLTGERKALLDNYHGRAIKSVMVDLSNVASHIAKEDDPEKIIARDGSLKLRRLMTSQGILMDKLESDLSQLRRAFNERILYFRRLQEFSDSVAEVQWDGDVETAIEICKAEQAELMGKINTGKARQRYLDHIARSQEDGDVDDDDKTCVLCRCEFVRGFITQCAHVFCEGCLQAWLQKNAAAKACPVCRVPINIDQLQRFSLRDIQREKSLPQPVSLSTDSMPKSRRVIEYNKIDDKLFHAIEEMESHGSYGSKIQTLIRHLLYLQQHEPGAKSIVFSAWADSLHIIEHALNHNGIACLRIDQTRGKENPAKKFRTSPDISVLLLHGERENAGLNVTCASRVFLLESVVQHSFEIQAIARIDRMGQKKPTEVYCYYAEETVEKNILDLAARQGLSLYTKRNASGTLDITAFAVETEKKVVDAPGKHQKGDFIFKTDDMMAILFPHMFEDIEYLLPEDHDKMNIEHHSAHESLLTDPAGLTAQQAHPRQTNAVAGPSRPR